jgi:hypothetical protein
VVCGEWGVPLSGSFVNCLILLLYKTTIPVSRVI